MSAAQILRFRDIPLRTEYPNHNQPVERNVALMSKCSKRVIGEDRQAGQQIATGIFRSAHPSRKRKMKNKKVAAAKKRRVST